MRFYTSFRSLVFICVILLFIWTAVPAVAAQSASDNTQSWGRFLNTDDTLALAVSDSHLWQGINGGLLLRNLAHPEIFRFYHTLNSPIRSNQVYAVALDSRGSAWLGTENGAAYLSSQGEWSFYNQENSPLTADAVRTIALDEGGGVWLGTWGSGAFYRDSNGRWSSYNTENSGIAGNDIHAVSPDSRGGVWFATDSRGAAYLSPQGLWTIYNTQNSDLPVNDVLDIHPLVDGRVGFATYKGLSFLDLLGRWQHYSTTNSPLPSDIIYTIDSGDDGTVWAGTDKGLARLSASGNWTIFTTATSPLPSNSVRSVALDKAGRVWAGTWGGGLSVFNPAGPAWRVYNQDRLNLPGGSALLSNTVNHVLPVQSGDDAAIWFSTGKGAAFFEPASASWERFTAERNPFLAGPINQVAFHETRGTLFVTKEGLVLWKGGTFRAYREDNSELPSHAVTDALFDEYGNLWLSFSNAGVSRLATDGRWTHYHTANSPLPSNQVNAMTLDKAGRIWFGTWVGGAAVLDQEGGWHIYNVSNSGLPVNDVAGLQADSEGNMWFGTWGGGLARLNKTGGWTLYQAENSPLPSNVIRSLALDSRGWLWVATSQGAAYHNGREIKVVRAEESGLPVNNLYGAAADDRGSVWLTTFDSGVVVYNPEVLPEGLTRAVDVTQKPDILLYYGGYFEPDVPARLESGRTLVPMRAIFSALGATFTWDGQRGRVEAFLQHQKIELTINQTRAYINGEAVELDVPARLYSGRTLIPLRFAAESLGLTVVWDPVLHAVIFY